MTPILLAYIGVALMMGVCAVGSCLGTTVTAEAAVGAMKKNKAAFSSYMILSALPGSQGLYGFVCYFIVKPLLVPEITMFQAAAIFGVGAIMGMAGIYSSYRQGKVCANGIVAIGNGHDVFVNTLILAALPELYAILGVAAVYLVNQAITPDAVQAITDAVQTISTQMTDVQGFSSHPDAAQAITDALGTITESMKVLGDTTAVAPAPAEALPAAVQAVADTLQTVQ